MKNVENELKCNGNEGMKCNKLSAMEVWMKMKCKIGAILWKVARGNVRES